MTDTDDTIRVIIPLTFKGNNSCSALLDTADE